MFGRRPNEEDPPVDLAERLALYSIEDRGPVPDDEGEPAVDPAPARSRWDVLPPRP